VQGHVTGREASRSRRWSARQRKSLAEACGIRVGTCIFFFTPPNDSRPSARTKMIHQELAVCGRQFAVQRGTWGFVPKMGFQRMDLDSVRIGEINFFEGGFGKHGAEQPLAPSSERRLWQVVAGRRKVACGLEFGHVLEPAIQPETATVVSAPKVPLVGTAFCDGHAAMGAHIAKQMNLIFHVARQHHRLVKAALEERTCSCGQMYKFWDYGKGEREFECIEWFKDSDHYVAEIRQAEHPEGHPMVRVEMARDQS
jgi:hypothetical protein